jgi:hypothetical protein
VRQLLFSRDSDGIHGHIFCSAMHIKSYRTLFVVHAYITRLKRLNLQMPLRTYAQHTTKMENPRYVCQHTNLDLTEGVSR